MLYRGDATRRPADTFSLPLHVWRRASEERQGTVTESLAAFAQPAGLTVRGFYETLRDEILTDLRAAISPHELQGSPVLPCRDLVPVQSDPSTQEMLPRGAVVALRTTPLPCRVLKVAENDPLSG